MLKYSSLKESLIAYIRAKQLAPGDKLPGVRELMKEYSVSANTLSHALALLAGEGIIERRHGSGMYVRQSRMQAITIGIILTEADNPFLNRFLHHLTVMKEHYDLTIITKVSAFAPERERSAADELIKAGARGILLLPEPRGVNSRHFFALTKRGIPVVNVIRTFEGNIPSCTPDNRAIGRIAAEHLIRAGCRNLVYIGNARMRRIDERFRGFCDMVQEHGVTMNSRRIVFAEQENSVDAGQRSFTIAHGRCRSIDGIFAFHDLYAAGIMRACLKNGIRIPDAIRLVGCDDLDVAACLTPSLTSIDSGISRIASESLAMMTALLQGKSVRSIVITPRIIRREST